MTPADRPYPTASLCDALRSLWDPLRIRGRIVGGAWRAVCDRPVLGPAHTIRIVRATTTPPSPLTDFFAAVDAAAAGSVVVVEVVGDVTGAAIGGALATRFAQRGCRA